MKTFTAKIRLLTARPRRNPTASIEPFEAKDRYAATRIAAMKIAKLFYGETGQPGFITWDDDGAALACVGAYLGNGVLRGMTIRVWISEA